MKKQPSRQAVMNSNMARARRRINILTEHQASSMVLARQSPARHKNGVLWKDLVFVFNQKILPDDMVVVWHYPPYKKNIGHRIAKKLGIPYWPLIINHPRAQKIHIQTEPMTLPFARVVYGKKFLSQFGMVVAQRPRPTWYRDGHWLESHGGLEWWYGFAQNRQKSNHRVVTKDWAGLLSSPRKNNGTIKNLSVIASRQHLTAQQKRRVAFVDAIARDNSLQSMMDIFGSKRQFITDKAIGLEKYKYHVALENSLIPHYWTEKLADPLLAECFVFYAGAPNVGDYFDISSIMAIDIARPQDAIRLIKQTIKAQAYEKNLAAIKENKRRLMMDENLFNLIWRICHNYGMA